MIYVGNDFILDEIVKITGMSKSAVKKVIIAQRRIVQDVLSDGYGVRLMGLVDIMPEQSINRVNLVAKVNPTVKRPKSTRVEEPKVIVPTVVEDPDVD